MVALLSRRMVRLAIYIAVLIAMGLVVHAFVSPSRYGPPRVSYHATVSADGSRLVLRKWSEGAGNELWEGVPGAPLQAVAPPPGQRFAGTVAYAPAGNALLYTTKAADAPGGMGPERLWRQAPGTAPDLVLEDPLGIATVLPMRDGSILLRALVGERPKGWSPNPYSKGVWRDYAWVVWKPDGTRQPLRIKDTPFSGPSTLVRDEVLVSVSELSDPADPKAKPRYLPKTDKLLPDAKVPALPANLVPQGGVTAPRLACDWSGATCLRVTTYDRSSVYLHMAEVLRAERNCGVLKLQPRIEQAAMAADGNALVLLTRETPYVEQMRLVHLQLVPGGCDIRRQVDVALP